jgi:DNA repair ATPase RecN
VSSESVPEFPAVPLLPLSNELRAAYQILYDKLESAAENTTDLGTLEALNETIPQVDDILTKDRISRLEANTAEYQALLQQIRATNDQLKDLQHQVASVASHLSQAGDVIAAISKVFSFFPGL